MTRVELFNQHRLGKSSPNKTLLRWLLLEEEGALRDLSDVVGITQSDHGGPAQDP